MYINHQFIDGAKISHAGSLDDKRLLLVVGRRNYRKASTALETLVMHLHSSGISVVWYESKATITAKMLDADCEKFLPARLNAYFQSNKPLAPILRKVVKALFLLQYPSRWGRLVRAETHLKQSADLRSFLGRLATGKSVFILSHSAGGIVSSLIEDEPAVKGLVCFGYPFKHPAKGEEPARTRHLENMTKPFLIVQGRQDEYGGTEVLKQYRMSSAVAVSFVDSNHDYQNIPKEALPRLAVQLERFLGMADSSVGCSPLTEFLPHFLTNRPIGDGKAS